MLHRNPGQLGFCVFENVHEEPMCGRFTLDPTTKEFYRGLFGMRAIIPDNNGYDPEVVR